MDGECVNTSADLKSPYYTNKPDSMTNQASETIPEKLKSALTPVEKAAIEAIQNRKGSKITYIDFKGMESVPASSFIICQGNSTSQTAAIADNVREELRLNLDVKPYNYDGYRNAQWIVIDYGETMVHVFIPETREYYNIEDLWNDASITEIPDID